MERIDLSVEAVKRRENLCREACKPFIDEMVRVEARSIRPITLVGGNVIYGDYPAEVQLYLDWLKQQVANIVEDFKISEKLGTKRATTAAFYMGHQFAPEERTHDNQD